MRTRVAIVGGGISGLAAASRLVAADQTELVVLEATDRVGGRLRNEPIGPGPDDIIDAGGQFFGPNHARVLNLARVVDVEPVPLFTAGSALLDAASGQIRYRGHAPPLSDASARALDVATEQLDRLAASTPIDQPWEADDATQLDRMSAGEWLERTVPDPVARAVLELRFALSFTLPAARISMLHIAAFFAGVEGWAGYGQRLTFGARGGAAQIPVRLAQRLGARVLLSSPVRRIRKVGDEVELSCDDRRVTADRVIVALSPGECRAIDFGDSISTARHVLHALWQNGALLKLQFVYQRPFWREQGLSGWSLSLSEMPSMTFDASPPSGGAGVIGSLLTYGSSPFTPTANRVLLAPAEARRGTLTEALAARFGEAARAPQRVIETSWAGVPFMAGAVNPTPPGLLTAVGGALREPIGPIHWAGTETGRRWTGWMEGAIEAGQRAADEVRALL